MSAWPIEYRESYGILAGRGCPVNVSDRDAGLQEKEVSRCPDGTVKEVRNESTLRRGHMEQILKWRRDVEEHMIK